MELVFFQTVNVYKYLILYTHSPLIRDGTTHITYTLLQSCSQVGQSVISLGPNGEIHTAGFNGHAVVMITADELDVGLNQSVTVHVEVQEYQNYHQNIHL